MGPKSTTIGVRCKCVATWYGNCFFIRNLAQTGGRAENFLNMAEYALLT